MLTGKSNSRKNVILVCGLNGAGKSTLSRALAERLNCKWIDMEDIYFSRQDNPDYPYEKSRPYEEVVKLLAEITDKEELFVLASVTGDFGNDFISHLKCAVYMELPREIRLQRVYDRSCQLFGAKGRRGGDFYEQIKAFHSFCESRDERLVENWLSDISCPIIRVDGTLPTEDNVKLLVSLQNGPERRKDGEVAREDDTRF